MAPDDLGLEARFQRLEDLLEINQLFVDYGRYLDAGDFGSFAGLFAEDGELLLGPVARARGRKEIQAVMEASLASGVGSSKHIISSPAVTIDGDTATSVVMWTVIERDGDEVRVTMVGRHEDELVRRDGRWRIGRRKGFVDLPGSVMRRR
jgi:uncharacterized protein (TIGR02246 family)